MQAVFDYTASAGVGADAVLEPLRCGVGAPLTPGMGPLLRWLAGEGGAGPRRAECVIVSDANDLFIQAVLQAHGLAHVFAAVLTNTAVVVPPPAGGVSRLRITPHHGAGGAGGGGHDCGGCPANLCKRKALGDYLAARAAAGVSFTLVAYVGDGAAARALPPAFSRALLGRRRCCCRPSRTHSGAAAAAARLRDL